MSGGGYFAEGSTDAILAQSLRDGDVVLFNKQCTSLFSTNPLSGLLCLASKYGLSGEGRHCWDHAAIVVHKLGVPYLLEGSANGVTMRTYEERLLQGIDHQEVMLLPLRTANRDGDLSANQASAEERRRASALGGLMEELGLRRTADGFDAPGSTCCQNTWAAYRALRLPHSKRGIGPAAAAAALSAPRAEESAQPAVCTFGAPLVATALQRLGALGALTDAATVTPAALPSLPLSEPALFGRPVPVRSLRSEN